MSKNKVKVVEMDPERFDAAHSSYRKAREDLDEQREEVAKLAALLADEEEMKGRTAQSACSYAENLRAEIVLLMNGVTELRGQLNIAFTELAKADIEEAVAHSNVGSVSIS
ncbi:MAG: hypothetical protein FWD25_13525 [Clostridia bacterium]|nr:hypothetical protein [Clostridia bacterium]